MKRQLIIGLAALTLTGLFPACTTVVEDEKPTTHTTSTTTETTRVRPVQSTAVESTTVHSY